jgi:hypothetical protein
MSRPPIGKIAMTDAERHRRYMARLRSHAAEAKNNVTHNAPTTVGWEILVDDEGDGFICATVEPFDLYVRQDGDNEFSWNILKIDDPDADETTDDVTVVAEGEASSLVAALAAAEEAAATHGASTSK